MKTKRPLYLYAFYPAMGASLYATAVITYAGLTANEMFHLTFLAMTAGTFYFIASLFAARQTVTDALEEYVKATTLRGVFARTLYGAHAGRTDKEVDILVDSTLQAAVTHFIPQRAEGYIILRCVQFVLFIAAIFICVAVIAARPDIDTINLAIFSAAMGLLGLPCELLMMTRLWRPYHSDVTHWVAEHLGLEKTSV